jgi:hypothetical protein
MIFKQRKPTAGVGGVVSVPVSFETGEQGAYRVHFPVAVTITSIVSRVQKALAATDSGTVTGANATGASTGGVATHAASAAIGNEQTATPTTNVNVDAGSYYQLTTAKSTAGGKAVVSLQYKTRG